MKIVNSKNDMEFTQILLYFPDNMEHKWLYLDQWVDIINRP